MSPQEINEFVKNVFYGAVVAASLGLACIELFWLVRFGARFCARKIRRHRKRHA
jgi:hypothetical protein